MESAESERLASVAVGEQSEVADLDQAGGQDMEQEAADELDSFEARDAAAVAMPGVPPAEAHLSVFEAEQPCVGDGDAMRVAGQILQHMFRSSEGRLGVDHPLCSAQGAKQSVKCAWRCQFGQLAGEAEFAAPVALLEEGEQLAAEHAAEHTHREEETASSAWDPTGVIESKSAGGNEAMQVWMMSQVLRPGVQHSKHPDARTEMAWIGGNLQQRLGCCAKQQAIEQTLVPECERRPLLRHGEDHMGVGHRQQA